MRYRRRDRGHEGIRQVAGGVDAGYAGLAALVDLEGDTEWRVDRGQAEYQKSLSKLQYEAGPAHVIAQIEALLRQLDAKAALNVPDPRQSARLFAALLKGSDLLIIARFDEAIADDDTEIESYCRSAVTMFMAAHGGNDPAR